MTIQAMTPRLRELVQHVHGTFVQTPAGYAARPYSEALLSTPDGATSYHSDEVSHLVMYLISNIGRWRSAGAKATKAELKALAYGFTPREVSKAVDKLGEARSEELLEGVALSNASYDKLARLIGEAA